MPYKVVAANLGIDISSVDTYRRRAYRKLGTSNIVDAVRRMKAQRRVSVSVSEKSDARPS